jgi:hypothetical protein
LQKQFLAVFTNSQQSETFADIEILQKSEMEKNPNTCLIGEDVEKKSNQF